MSKTSRVKKPFISSLCHIDFSIRNCCSASISYVLRQFHLQYYSGISHFFILLTSIIDRLNSLLIFIYFFFITYFFIFYINYVCINITIPYFILRYLYYFLIPPVCSARIRHTSVMQFTITIFLAVKLECFLMLFLMLLYPFFLVGRRSRKLHRILAQSSLIILRQPAGIPFPQSAQQRNRKSAEPEQHV